MHFCGLVHDVGKIGLPAGLLEKPGALSLEERRQMEQHPAIGERILRNVDDYAEIAAIVRHHHERFDGLGYPDRPRETIFRPRAVIAVADAYNAMTSDRPYRDAMPSRVARLRLAQAVESQFDTSVVAAFEAILAARQRSTGWRCSLRVRADTQLRVESARSVVGRSNGLRRRRAAFAYGLARAVFSGSDGFGAACERRASRKCGGRAPSRSTR